jgi:hypothetical protein
MVVPFIQEDPKNWQIVVPKFSDFIFVKKKDRQKMKNCYKCAPNTVSPPNFWVHSLVDLRKKLIKFNLPPSRALLNGGTSVGGPMGGGIIWPWIMHIKCVRAIRIAYTSMQHESCTYIVGMCTIDLVVCTHSVFFFLGGVGGGVGQKV